MFCGWKIGKNSHNFVFEVCFSYGLWPNKGKF